MALLDISQSLQRTLVENGGEKSRATLEIDPVKRPWNKASAIFFTIMKEHAILDRDMFPVPMGNPGTRCRFLTAPKRGGWCRWFRWLLSL